MDKLHWLAIEVNGSGLLGILSPPPTLLNISLSGFHCLQGSSVSLSRSNSREHLGSGSESDNFKWCSGPRPSELGSGFSFVTFSPQEIRHSLEGSEVKC